MSTPQSARRPIASYGAVDRPVAPKARPAPVGPARYEAILSAAADLFVQKGYSETSLQDIADACGLTKPSLYHYIHAKEDLLFAIVETTHQSMGPWREVLAADGAPDRQVATIVAAHLLVGTRSIREVRVFYQAHQHMSAPKFEPILEERALYAHAVREVVERGQAQGKFATDIDAGVATISMLSLLNSTSLWFDPAGKWKASDLWQTCLVMILRGLGVQKRQIDRLLVDPELLALFADGLDDGDQGR